jgi:hypothetical protein
MEIGLMGGLILGLGLQVATSGPPELCIAADSGQDVELVALKLNRPCSKVNSGEYFKTSAYGNDPEFIVIIERVARQLSSRKFKRLARHSLGEDVASQLASVGMGGFIHLSLASEGFSFTFQLNSAGVRVGVLTNEIGEVSEMGLLLELACDNSVA